MLNQTGQITVILRLPYKVVDRLDQGHIDQLTSKIFILSTVNTFQTIL